MTLRRVKPFWVSKKNEINIFENATLIYSVQKLNPLYSGNCWLVRRVSDSVTQNIGFDSNGLVDQTALNSFLGAGQGRLVTWYDQIGSNNATAPNTSFEPLIWNNGFYTTLSKPTVFFESVLLARKLVFSSEIELNSTNGSFSCLTATSVGSEQSILGHSTLNRQFRRQFNFLKFLGSPNDLTAQQLNIQEPRVSGWEIYKSAANHRVYDYVNDGNLISYTTSISYKFNQIGCVLTDIIPLDGNLSEFIFFNDITNVDISAVKSHRKNYFGL